MTDLHAEVGSYVTDSLDTEERTAFEAHLLGCEYCRGEVAEFDETLAELATLSATAPPPGLRASVLAGIREVRPLPPLESSDQGVEPTPITALRPDGLHPRRGRSTAPSWDRPVDELAERRQWRRTRILTAAVAATLVVALGLGGWVFSLVQQQQALTAQERLATANAQRERSLVAAPDARVVSRTEGAAVYSFVFSKSRNEALFLGTNLADPGAGKTYQLWTAVGKKPPTPNALVSGSGRTETWLDGQIEEAAAFAVSVEPAGGSTEPTDIKAEIPL